MIAISYALDALASSKWLARAAIFALMLTLLLWVKPAAPTDIIETVSEVPAQIKKAIKPADLQCLAENIYHEAGNQPELGKVAVGVVTLNRTQDSRFPNSICGVVRQMVVTEEGKKCQFNWWCMDKPAPNRNTKNWKDSLRIARMLLEGGYEQYQSLFENVLFFHASSLKTNWTRYHARVAQIGDHVFYR